MKFLNSSPLATSISYIGTSKAKVFLQGVNYFVSWQFQPESKEKPISQDAQVPAIQRPPALTIRHSTFPTVLFCWGQMWEAAPKPSSHKMSLWVFTEAWSRQLPWSCQPESNPPRWHLAGWLSNGVDLWLMKDGQINIPGILDRIRFSMASVCLHPALT